MMAFERQDSEALAILDDSHPASGSEVKCENLQLWPGDFTLLVIRDPQPKEIQCVEVQC